MQRFLRGLLGAKVLLAATVFLGSTMLWVAGWAQARAENMAAARPEGGLQAEAPRPTMMVEPKQVEVPALQGMTVAEAQLRLAGTFVLQVLPAGTAASPQGKIATQRPLANTNAPEHSTVYVELEAPAVPNDTVPQGQPVSTGAGSAAGKVATTPPESATTTYGDTKPQKESATVPYEGAKSPKAPAAKPQPKPKANAPPEQSFPLPAWVWYAAGWGVLAVLCAGFLWGWLHRVPPLPMAAVMLPRPNPSTAHTTMTQAPVVLGAVRLRDRASAGVTAIPREIEGERR